MIAACGPRRREAGSVEIRILIDRIAARLLAAIGLVAAGSSFLLSCSSAPPPEGVRVERVAAPSLPSPNEVYVLLPPSYDRSPERRYPVLYFLHDGYGDGRTLVRRGVAADALAAMRDGTLPEFLIVAPDGPGTWFSDFYDGSQRFEQFLAVDLPAAIASRYRVLDGAGSRGVTGISMGGYGAVKTALKHPGRYGAVSSVSGAIIPFEWEELKRYNWVARFTLMRVFGRDREKNSLIANDAWHILWGLCFDRPPFVAELRAGTSDVYGLDGVATQYGMLMNERGVPTTVVLEPGGHDWGYWRGAMRAVLEWHGKRFEYDSRAMKDSPIPGGR
jgi:S-formylglutathione hydrolase FrmB